MLWLAQRYSQIYRVISTINMISLPFLGFWVATPLGLQAFSGLLLLSVLFRPLSLLSPCWHAFQLSCFYLRRQPRSSRLISGLQTPPVSSWWRNTHTGTHGSNCLLRTPTHLPKESLKVDQVKTGLLISLSNTPQSLIHAHQCSAPNLDVILWPVFSWWPCVQSTHKSCHYSLQLLLSQRLSGSVLHMCRENRQCYSPELLQ